MYQNPLGQDPKQTEKIGLIATVLAMLDSHWREEKTVCYSPDSNQSEKEVSFKV